MPARNLSFWEQSCIENFVPGIDTINGAVAYGCPHFRVQLISILLLFLPSFWIGVARFSFQVVVSSLDSHARRSRCRLLFRRIDVAIFFFALFFFLVAARRDFGCSSWVVAYEDSQV